MVVHTHHPSTWEVEAGESFLNCVVNLKPAWASWDPVSKDKTIIDSIFLKTDAPNLLYQFMELGNQGG